MSNQSALATSTFKPLVEALEVKKDLYKTLGERIESFQTDLLDLINKEQELKAAEAKYEQLLVCLTGKMGGTASTQEDRDPGPAKPPSKPVKKLKPASKNKPKTTSPASAFCLAVMVAAGHAIPSSEIIAAARKRGYNSTDNNIYNFLSIHIKKKQSEYIKKTAKGYKLTAAGYDWAIEQIAAKPIPIVPRAIQERMNGRLVKA